MVTKNISGFIASISLLVFPATILIIDNISGFISLVAVFWGSIFMLTKREVVFPLSSNEKIFFASASLLLISAFVTVYVAEVSLSKADRFFTVFLIIPMYVFFKQSKFEEKYLWAGLILGAFTTLSMSIYDVFFLGQAQANGTTHHIIYGSMSLFMGVLALVSIKRYKGWWWTVLPVLAFFAGATSSVLSTSRSGWITLLFFIPAFMFYALQLWPKKHIFSLFLIGMISLVVIYSNSSILQNRIERSIVEVTGFYESTDVNDPIRGTSIGTRLEMWGASWVIFKDNPIVGVGWGEYQNEAQKLVDKGLFNQSIANHFHPHNQFFSALVKGGGLGFLAVLATLFVPFYLFFTMALKGKGLHVRRVAFAGLLFSGGYIIFSLTEVPFEGSKSVTSFAFYIAVLMAMVQKHNAEGCVDEV